MKKINMFLKNIEALKAYGECQKAKNYVLHVSVPMLSGKYFQTEATGKTEKEVLKNLKAKFLAYDENHLSDAMPYYKDAPSSPAKDIVLEIFNLKQKLNYLARQI